MSKYRRRRRRQEIPGRSPYRRKSGKKLIRTATMILAVIACIALLGGLFRPSTDATEDPEVTPTVPVVDSPTETPTEPTTDTDTDTDTEDPTEEPTEAPTEDPTDPTEDPGTEEQPTLISFTIEGVEYQALEGMTWGEWVESEYNTGDFVWSNAPYSHITTTAGMQETVMYGGSAVYAKDSIVADRQYEIDESLTGGQ